MYVKRRPQTPILCPNCGSRNLVCSYKNRETNFLCIDCKKVGIIECTVSIRKQDTAANSQLVEVLFGPWNKDEIELILSSAKRLAHTIPAINDDWRFFKGRNLYTSWRYSWRDGRVITSKNLDDLIDEVETACHSIHQ